MVFGSLKYNSHSAFAHALDATFARIEFKPDGTITDANDHFLKAMGYTLKEISGKHHRMFVDPVYAKSPEYQKFWTDLNAGNSSTAEFCRYGKGGKEIWIQASYIPLKTGNTVHKVVKLATDITEHKQKTANAMGQISAISRSQAVIEFNMDGTILTANQNFLDTVGYTADEIIGQHHRMFVDVKYANSPEYAHFWRQLNDGHYLSDEYLRYGKNHKEVWIQASYNPILDANGVPYKVVKYATDISATKLRNAYYEGLQNAISRSQAMIEFEPDGTIVTANALFLGAVGYELNEIVGQHHRMFVEPALKNSPEYQQFWQDLASGIAKVAEFKRLKKDGTPIWIQASYNPIVDAAGNVYKIVKLATDITELMAARIRAGDLSTDVRSNIQSVAGAAEELLSSVNEISENMGRSQQAVTDIIDKNRAAEHLTEQLQENTKSMERIADIIRDISEQVNLLALNAIIESARAGDAGKGFAVVAGEVKNLANATAKATDQISEQITAVQSIATKVFNSGNVIADATKNMGEYVNSVAAALEEQTAANQEISSSLTYVTTGVSHLDDCINLLSNKQDDDDSSTPKSQAAE